MAVKHKVVECVEPQAELTLILRALQNINAIHQVKGIELVKLCESIVLSLGKVTMPTKTEDYMNFIRDVRSVQEILIQACSSHETIFATLKALYSAISVPSKHRQPTMSIVLQLIDVKAIPTAVKLILQAGYTENNLEEALMTLCNWLSRWTWTPNLGPLVLHFMKGLESEQHYDILIEVTVTYIERLFKLLVLPESRKTVGPVVLHMLSSMQHTPVAFHKVIPHARIVFFLLHKENSESSFLYLKDIVNLCIALMNHFPGFKALYEELMLAMEPIRPLNFKQQLNCKSWISGSNLIIPVQNLSGKVGLNNLGNTCYMNSVLQALFMTKLFRNDILLTNRDCMPLLFSKLQILFALLQHSPRSSLSPSDILSLAKPPGFQPGHQHDSSEFLGYLLDVLHEQETSCVPPATHAGNSSQTTIVQDTFGGRAVTIYKCGNCNTQSERADYFRDLQLSFPSNSGNQSVQTLLDYYLQPEILCGDNQYHCDTCRGLTDGERITKVVEPPSRLVLTLKHFRYDPASQQRTKLLQHVKLDNFIHLDSDYELYAAVFHVGSSLDSGHYYTYARDGQDWYKFNDCIVTRSTAEELCSVKPPETPYILFYSKQDCIDPDPLPRSVLSPALEAILIRDNTDLDTERRRKPLKTYENHHKRNDEPPPPGCGGGNNFMSNSNSNRYVC